MTVPSFLTVHMPCDMALLLAKKKLSQSGLRTLQTFDLCTARHLQQDCPCPHHGTEDCDCQMIVLMVYGEMAEPAALILHGKDGYTWFSIAEPAQPGADRSLHGNIRRALEVGVLAIQENR